MIHTFTPSSHHYHGGGSDVPGWMVGAYVLVALVVWAVVALYTARHLARTETRWAPGGLVRTNTTDTPTNGQIGEGVIAGGMAAVAWPISLAAGLMWWAIRRHTTTGPQQ